MIRGRKLRQVESVSRATSRTAGWIILVGIALVRLDGQTIGAEAFAAHPISVTEAVVFVQREKIAVKLDVFVEDLYLFHDLQPDRANRLVPADIVAAREKHKSFLLERFQIRDANGELLRGTPVGVDEFTMPADGISLDDLMTYSYGFRFEYPLDSPLEFVTVAQNLIDEAAGIPAEMQLRVKQEGSESPYYAVLNPGEPVTVRFSWDKPPLSPDASEGEWEEWLTSRREETLGITSYSSVYSFIYITDREVRHEILAPLATLESSILIPRADESFLELEEQPEAAEQIAAYFSSGNPVTVNGELVKPVVNRVDFFGVDFRDFAQQAPKRRVSMASARAGIILSYPLEHSPEQVAITWDRFNRYIFSVRGVIYAFDKTLTTVFSRYGTEQTFRWSNPGRPPLPPLQPIEASGLSVPMLDIPMASVVSLLAMPIGVSFLWWFGASRRVRVGMAVVCLALSGLLWPFGHRAVANPWAKRPVLDPSQAEVVFEGLHANLYRAFDYVQEDQIYDALSRTVDGPLLHDLYLQIRKGLAMQEQGGAQSTIEEVQLVDGSLDPASSDHQDIAFDYRAKWTVKGTVEHWGHIHARTNQYEGLFHVAPVAGAWKFTRAEILNEERVGFETKLRGL